jgi:hypothetical protein
MFFVIFFALFVAFTSVVGKPTHISSSSSDSSSSSKHPDVDWLLANGDVCDGATCSQYTPKLCRTLECRAYNGKTFCITVKSVVGTLCDDNDPRGRCDAEGRCSTIDGCDVAIHCGALPSNLDARCASMACDVVDDGVIVTRNCHVAYAEEDLPCGTSGAQCSSGVCVDGAALSSDSNSGAVDGFHGDDLSTSFFTSTRIVHADSVDSDGVAGTDNNNEDGDEHSWFDTPLDFAQAGPYARIGLQRFIFNDSSRARGGGTPTMSDANRLLQVWVWYPADFASTYGRTDFYGYNESNAVYDGTHSPYGAVYASFILAQSRRTLLNAAPTSTTSGTFPAVLLNHGTNGDVFGLYEIAEHLASHGFIVVGVDASCATRYGLSSDGVAIAGGSLDFVKVTVADNIFVMNASIARASLDSPTSDSPFPRIDVSNWGCAGHSSGASVCHALMFNGISGMTGVTTNAALRALFFMDFPDRFETMTTRYAGATQTLAASTSTFWFGGKSTATPDNGHWAAYLAAAPATYWFEVPELRHDSTCCDIAAVLRTCALFLQGGGGTTRDQTRCRADRSSWMPAFAHSRESAAFEGITNATLTTLMGFDAVDLAKLRTAMPLTRLGYHRDITVARQAYAVAMFTRHLKSSASVAVAQAVNVLSPAYAAERFPFGTLRVADPAPIVASTPPPLFGNGSRVRFVPTSASSFPTPRESGRAVGGYAVYYFGNGTSSFERTTNNTSFGTRVINPTSGFRQNVLDVATTTTFAFPLPEGQAFGPSVRNLRVQLQGFVTLLSEGDFTSSLDLVGLSAARVGLAVRGNFAIAPFISLWRKTPFVVSGEQGVYVINEASRFVVTWAQLGNYVDNFTRPSTFQLAMYPNGTIDFTYGGALTSQTIPGWTLYGIMGVGNGRVAWKEGHNHVVDFASLSSSTPTYFDVGAISQSWNAALPAPTLFLPFSSFEGGEFVPTETYAEVLAEEA